MTISTCEAEWTALALGMRHGQYLRNILKELGFEQGTTVWYEDNLSTVKAASTPGFSGRTKHVDIKIKCTREFVQRGLFSVRYIPSKEQLADILTKRLRGYQQAAFLRDVLSRL